MCSSTRKSQNELIIDCDSEKNGELLSQSQTDELNGPSSNTSRKSEHISPTCSHISVPNSPIQVHVTSVASCPEISNPSPTSSPQPSPKMQLKFRDKLQSSPSSVSSVSRDVSAEKIVEFDSPSLHGCEDAISRSSESVKSVDFHRSSDVSSVRDFSKEKKTSDKKKKTSSWYNVLNPTYKSRSDDFKRLFKDLPENERLIVDYSCALQKDILVHGRLYISQNYICFYANIFRWETMLIIQCKDVTAMTKEKTARVIPNAIQICTDAEKHFFTSFGARDKTYLMLFRVWQNALMEQPMSIQELWQWVHYSYGDELGLTSDDDDYVAPSAEDDTKNNNGFVLLQDGKEIKSKTPTLESSLEPITKALLKESPTGSTESQPALINCSRRETSDIPDTSFDKSISDKLSIPISKIHSLVESNIPTDLSDTTESENDLPREILCPCNAHFGREIINVVYPMSVDQVYNLLFSESKFYVDFLHSRKTTDIVQSAWQDHPETGNKLRQVTYTLQLSLSMGPKTAQTTETQTMMNMSKAGSIYVIDVDAVNTGVPYSDTFYTCHRYCLTHVSPNECRVRVHSQIKYRKSVWGLVKTFIEKNVMQGVEEYLRDLEVALQKECSRFTQQIQPKKIRRRRRHLKQDSLKSDASDGKAMHSHSAVNRLAPNGGQLEISRLVANPDLLIKIIICVLVGLLFLNALLYYKLWSLENQTAKMVLPPSLLDMEFLKNSPRSEDDWANLVQQQETLHQVELQKWTEILQSAVHLLQQTEDSLSALQKSIRPYQLQRVLQLFADRQSKEVSNQNS